MTVIMAIHIEGGLLALPSGAIAAPARQGGRLLPVRLRFARADPRLKLHVPAPTGTTAAS